MKKLLLSLVMAIMLAAVPGFAQTTADVSVDGNAYQNIDNGSYGFGGNAGYLGTAEAKGGIKTTFYTDQHNCPLQYQYSQGGWGWSDAYYWCPVHQSYAIYSSSYYGGYWSYNGHIPTTYTETHSYETYVPAQAYGLGQGEVIGDGHSDSGGLISSSCGSSKVTSNVQTTAIGGENKTQKANTSVEGNTWQFNNSHANGGSLGTWTNQGNESFASYSAKNQDQGNGYASSSIMGEATAYGYTYSTVFGDGINYAQADGWSQSDSQAWGTGGKKETATGSGFHQTNAWVNNGDSYAQAGTGGTYSYNNKGNGYASGSGATQGTSSATTTPIANGMSVSSSANSYSSSNGGQAN